jgi:hypothetical protein
MSKGQIVRVVIAAGLVITAAVVFVLTRPKERVAGAYFYDLSEGRLFVAPQDQVPPIEGVGGESGDGVLAIVVGGPGVPVDEHAILYLTRFTDEYRALLEEERRTGNAANVTRAYQRANTLVRLVDGDEWLPSDTDAGYDIITRDPGRCPDGSLRREVRPD